MATVIDSLLVTLGLDASAFKKGNQEVQKTQKDFVALTKKGNKDLSELDSKAAAQRAKNAKEMQAQGKKAVETFVSMRNQALSLLAVFTAGMGILAFAKHTVFTTSALGRLSKNVDISTRELGGWSLAAREMGGSAEGMMSDINNVSQSLAKFRTGLPDSGIQAFFQYGGGSGNGELKDTKSYLFAMADLLSKINETDPAKAQMVANALGLSYESFNLMKQGGVALRKQIDLNAELAGVTEKNAEEAQRAQKAWADLSTTLEKLGREILFPLLTELNNWMTAHQADIVNGIKAFIAEANGAAEALGGWKNVLTGLIGLKVLSIVAPLLALGAALVKVGGGLASISRFGGFLGGMLASKSLNEGEDAEMAKLRQSSPKKSGGTRGMRNNNPGNLKYGPFAKTHGAVGQDAQGFAIFPDMALGEYAAKSLLGSYFSRGHDTVRKVISRYAPSSENNTGAYINAVSRRLGVGADDKLNNSHINALASSIFRHENGAGYSASPLFGMNRGPMRLSGVNNTTSSEVHIGKITVNTQATDARGIAGSIGNELRSSGYLVGQANTGMQ
jgi:hypothetical protein